MQWNPKKFAGRGKSRTFATEKMWTDLGSLQPQKKMLKRQ